jgi:hypothetical protein
VNIVASSVSTPLVIIEATPSVQTCLLLNMGMKHRQTGRKRKRRAIVAQRAVTRDYNKAAEQARVAKNNEE